MRSSGVSASRSWTRAGRAALRRRATLFLMTQSFSLPAVRQCLLQTLLVGAFSLKASVLIVPWGRGNHRRRGYGSTRRSDASDFVKGVSARLAKVRDIRGFAVSGAAAYLNASSWAPCRHEGRAGDKSDASL